MVKITVEFDVAYTAPLGEKLHDRDLMPNDAVLQSSGYTPAIEAGGSPIRDIQFTVQCTPRRARAIMNQLEQRKDLEYACMYWHLPDWLLTLLTFAYDYVPALASWIEDRIEDFNMKVLYG